MRRPPRGREGVFAVAGPPLEYAGFVYPRNQGRYNPDRKPRLMKELDGFLERDRDRELFGLAPKEASK